MANEPRPAFFSWQQPLAMLGAGIAAASSPGGWSNFGPAVSQAGRDWRTMEIERERFDILRQQADRQRQQFEAEQRRANQEAETRAATQKQIAFMFGGAQPGAVNTASAPQPGQAAMLGGLLPVTSHGNYGAATGGRPAMFSQPNDAMRPDGSPVSFSDVQNGGMGSPTQQGADGAGLPFGFNQEQAQLFQALPLEQQMQILTERAFAKPTTPDLQTFYEGDQEYQGYVGDNGQVVRVTPNAPRWQRQQGAGLTERQRNALAAGLVEGTPEYEQYILGRDDNEGGGPFEGTGLDNQAMNILLTGDPASPEYAAAYSHLAMPRVQMDPQTGRLLTVSPDLSSWARPPANVNAAMPPASAQGAGQMPFMPGITGSRPGPTVQNAQTMPQPTPAAPGTETMRVPGATITSNPGTGLSGADRTKLRTVRAEAASIRDALTRFRDVVQSSNLGDDLSAVGGGFTEGGRKLNSAWTNAAIMTKAEALFNLGVLNGPDLSVIQGTLPNPSTWSGLFTSEAAASAAVDEVLRLIDSKVAAYEQQFGGISPETASPNAGGAPSGGTRVDQLPAGNWQ
jgi:hypothetical protein